MLLTYLHSVWGRRSSLQRSQACFSTAGCEASESLGPLQSLGSSCCWGLQRWLSPNTLDQLLTTLNHSLFLEIESTYNSSQIKRLPSKQKGTHRIASESGFHIYRLLKKPNISYFPHAFSSKGKGEKWVSDFTQQLTRNLLRQPAFMNRQLSRRKSKRGCGEQPVSRGKGHALLPCQKHRVEKKIKSQVMSRATYPMEKQ